MLLYDIAFITGDFVHSYVGRAQSLDVITVRCLLELLYVRHRYSSLSLFTCDELVHAISQLIKCAYCFYEYVYYVPCV